MLSSHDKNVLAFLIPEHSKGGIKHVYKILDKPMAEKVDLKNKVCENDQERMAMEAEAIKLAECHRLHEALVQINFVIESFPDHPSPLNNRAQIFRLLRRDDEALTDLNACINSASPDYPLVLRQAYAQRGWLRMAKDELAAAKEDFDTAAALGHTEARQMATRCNPYAAMCNAMLAQVMQTYYSR